MFDSYIAFHARSRPMAPAVVTIDGSISFEKLDNDINRAAAELADLAVAPDQSVSIAVAASYLEWVLVLALARRGIASAPSTDTASPHRITDGSAGSHPASRLLTPKTIRRILHGPLQPARPSRPDSKALARILHSSGTTGQQKRLGMSWNVIDAAIRNALIAYGAPDGPWLASTGIGTILGLVLSLACWASGNPVVLGLGGQLHPDRLAVLRPRLIALVPDQLQRLLANLPADYQKRPLRIISGGGPVPPPLARQTRLRLTDDLRSVYGASETGAVAIAGLALLEDQPGAAGYVLPGVDIEIRDDHGTPQPPGVLGQVSIRSNRVVDHWLGAAPPGSDWFDSADLGRLHADGLLMIEGRTDEMMNLGGHKVLPGWVEQAALACPGITDSAAVSLADGSGLERCWLAIVITPAFNHAELAGILRQQLRWLEKIHLLVLEKIPRNEMGKIQRDQLRQLAATSTGRNA